MFTRIIGLEPSITNNEEEFKHSKLVKINYSNKIIDDCLNIVPHSVLFDYGIKDYLVEVHPNDAYFKCFFKNNSGDIPFDVFGASFWLLSRYEEYLPFKANKYNAFDHRSSLAWQNDFLDKPLVNIWCEEFSKALKQKFPSIKFKPNYFRSITTIDIDNVYKFKHKGFVRSLAGVASDIRYGNFRQLKQRIKTMLFGSTDEFDCYEYLVETNKKNKTQVIYFFLLGDYGMNDKNHPSSNLTFQKLMKHLSDYSLTGIHPSFASNFNTQQLKIEIARLGGITHKEVVRSRQHFGMLKFPTTYTNLIQSGIKNDYSLGYTNINGFRASVCNSFKWYDIGLEQETPSNCILFVLGTYVWINKVIQIPQKPSRLWPAM
ncbi:MAG: hypothetical protein IPJ60_18120 [Sphingobacteriaceae bacterium]|nr:hypothetical protein [Sphingobacteriaceae bacterium]